MTLLIIGACTDTSTTPIVIGHRGAAGHTMENSLPSIQKAIDLGADAVEIDVFKISDGTIVVFHDNTLDRLTEHTGSIENLNKSDLDTVLLKGGIKIPTLEEVLDLIDKKIMLNIELKGANTASSVNIIIKKYISEKGWTNSDFIISSFKWDELEEMRSLNPDIPIGILTSDDIDGALIEAEKVNAKTIHPNFKKLNEVNIKSMHSKGCLIYAWTVNEISDIAELTGLGIDGIITDYPDRVK
ncbi:MAG: glycerophosphodiester phosphodiesterase [Bacteroidales bacterium]